VSTYREVTNNFLNEINDEAVEMILREHPEVRVLWEKRPLLPEQVSINEVNPVLHVIIEAMAETQYRLNDPLQVPETINKFISRGFSHHAARGIVANILVISIYDALQGVPFDESAYIKRLHALDAPDKKPGRNELCYCGSGKKFKRCCLSFVSNEKPSECAGQLILGAGCYASFDYLQTCRPENPLLSMENRVHISEYLERHELIKEAYSLLQENVYLAEHNNNPGALHNALLDVLELCQNHHSLAEKGLAITDRLVEIAQNNDEGNLLICDKAEFLRKVGREDEAYNTFSSLLKNVPDWHFGRYRYALFLSELNKTNEAVQILELLIKEKGRIDEETYDCAEALLCDLRDGECNQIP
jgi:tetratricopeptide (TPR) repeat protein